MSTNAAFAVLALLLSGVSPAAGQLVPGRPQSLLDAASTGLVTVTLRGTGSSSGDSIVLDIARTAKAGPGRLVLSLAPGTILKSSSASAQNMVVARVRGRMVGETSFTLSTSVVSRLELTGLRTMTVPDPKKPDFVVLSGEDRTAGYVFIPGPKPGTSVPARMRYLFGINRSGVWAIALEAIESVAFLDSSSAYPFDEKEAARVVNYTGSVPRYGYFGQRGTVGGTPYAITWEDARQFARGNLNVLVHVADRQDPVRLSAVSPAHLLRITAGDTASSIAFDQLRSVTFAAPGTVTDSRVPRKARILLRSGTEYNADAVIETSRSNDVLCGNAVGNARRVYCISAAAVVGIEVNPE